MNADLLLASNSPRRAELLDQLGVRYLQRGVDVDESAFEGERPEDLVLRLANSKAKAGFAVADGLVALGSDTVVIYEGQILGKPHTREQAAVYLRILSGQQHEVLTAVALCQREKLSSVICRSKVRFSVLGEDTISRYCASDEALDKAGAYGIQGRAAAFIEHIEGSYSGIMGLPLAETAVLLTEFKVPYWV